MWTYQGNNRQEQVPFRNSLSLSVNNAVADGYTECFKVTSRGLYAISKGRYYRPEQVRVIDSRHFEDEGNLENHAVMYVIEASDGVRGTLIDTCASSCDVNVNRFIAEAEDIRKKVARANQHEC